MSAPHQPDERQTLARRFNEAITLSNELKFAEAAEGLRGILGQWPAFSEAAGALTVVLSNLAVIHNRNGDVDGATACLIESLCLSPGSEERRTLLAELLTHKAKRDIADRRTIEAFLALGRALRITRVSSPQQQDLVLEALALDGYSMTPGMSWFEKLQQVELIIDRAPELWLPKAAHLLVTIKHCEEVVDRPALDSALPALRRSALHAHLLLDTGRAGSQTLIMMINALAAILSRYGDSDKGLDLLEKLAALAPLSKEIHQNRLFANLYKGDLDAAWRRQHWDDLNRCLELPMWDGHTPGSVIHLINNNGMGDFLQSIRHIPALSAFFDEVHIWDKAFVTQKHRQQVAAMLARSKGFEKVRLQPGLLQPATSDIYCELFLLPLALQATRRDYADPKPYLSADPDLVARWSAVTRRPGRVSVAFSWSMGGGIESNMRNFGVANIATLFECSDKIDFYSIQNNASKFDLLEVDRPATVTDLGIVDLEHMAAIMNSVDVVISPDCGLAHIAGATGANLWVGVHKYCDWRWRGTASEQTLYASTRMFRQPVPGDWNSVCADMRGALIAFVNETIAPRSPG